MEKSSQKPESTPDPGLPVILLGGATGSGKNRAALEIASRVPAEIVNADSRQVYRGLAIGTNQPSAEELQAAPHHLYGFLEPDAAISVAEYERAAMQALQDIQKRGRIPLFVGGTGFYMRAVLKGTWPVPAHDPVLRARLRRIQGRRGKSGLHALLKRVDAESAAVIAPNDSYRVMRALEIYFQSGKRRSEIRHETADRFRALKYFLDVPATQLEDNIRARTEAMLRAGWVEEVRELVLRHPDFASLPAARSLGYPEILALLDGRMTLQECQETVVRRTLQYARRQRTWFRNQDGFQPVSGVDMLLKNLESVLQ